MVSAITAHQRDRLAAGSRPESLAIVQRAPALQATFVDPVSGTTGFIVADGLVEGRAMGGTRITSGVTLAEVAELARLMNLKLALAGIEMGGAKGAVVLDPRLRGTARRQALAAFGRHAGPLLRGGVYIGTDLGCSYEDRALIFESAGYRVRDHAPSLPCSWDELWRRGRDVTGLGVAEASRVAADALGMPRERRSMAIQGFGEVGQAAARAAEARGFTVVAVADKYGTVTAPEGLPVQALCDLTDPYGTLETRRLPPRVQHSAAPEAWLGVAAEVLVLAATGGVITERNQLEIKARLVVEGANQPIRPAAIEALHARGVTIIPGIVANAGGAIGCGLALRGESPPGLDVAQTTAWLFEQTSRRVGRCLATILARGQREGRPLHHIAHELAVERLIQRESAAHRRCAS